MDQKVNVPRVDKGFQLEPGKPCGVMIPQFMHGWRSRAKGNSLNARNDTSFNSHGCLQKVFERSDQLAVVGDSEARAASRSGTL